MTAIGRRHILEPRTWLFAGLLSLGVFFPASQAYAYGTDVHFNLTYVEARLAGIDRNDALWIAFADESIDHNRSTSAYSGTIDTMFQFLGVHRYVWARNGERWQAYTDTGAPNNTLNGVMTTTHYTDAAAARAAVHHRRDVLWATALSALAGVQANERTTMIKADIAFGQFLHFEQDLYAHRQFGPSLDNEQWQPYGTFRGHSSEGYSPDYVALRPRLAREMLSSTFSYFQQWQQRRGARIADLSPVLAGSLITHISTAYDSRALQYPNHRFRPWFPPQRELNHQLTAALLVNSAARDWSADLPNANVLKYQLPYDQPMTPLVDVERRLGETLQVSPNIPFSALLGPEI
jgi:hypothetical protein